MNVSEAMQHAFLTAMARNPDLHEKWVSVMWRLSSGFARQASYYQSDCRLDMALREMEAEELARIHSSVSDDGMWTFDILSSMSRHWLLSVYEMMRTAKCSDAGKSHPRIIALHDKIKLVRIPIAKLEIANSSSLREPIILGRLRPDGAVDSLEEYSRDNPIEYTPPGVIDTRSGSIGWMPYDIKTQTTPLITRLELSDEMLRLFD